MADINTAIKVLRQEFPGASVGLDNDRPYARMPDRQLFGILFDTNHVGDPKWERGPTAIVRFPSGALSSRNWEIIKCLVRADDGTIQALNPEDFAKLV